MMRDESVPSITEAGLVRRLVDYPTRIDHLVGMIVLAKQSAG